MPVSLSIKSVPDDVVRALRQRAARNHRSIQGELMDILETAVRPKRFRADLLVKRIQDLGFSTPREAAAMIRTDRESR